MKKFMGLLLASLLVIVFSPNSIMLFAKQVSDAKLTIEISLKKKEILLGEPLELHFVLTNTGNHVTKLPIAVSPYVGNLSLWISKSRVEGYKRYSGPGWGMAEPGTVDPLEPGAKMVQEATVLFNIDSVFVNGTTSPFAFPKPGRYFLKAIFEQAELGKFESSPINVDVKAPEGTDATVWALFESDPTYALFIQTNSATSRDDYTHKIKKIEELLIKYPDNNYKQYLISSVNKFYEMEAHAKRINRENFEYTIQQMGDFLKQGKLEYVNKMLDSSYIHLQKTKLLPDNTPKEAYLGLAYLLAKDYNKAKDYLEPLVSSGSLSKSQLIMDAVAYIYVSTGNLQQAKQMIQNSRSEVESEQILKNFSQKFQNGSPFSFDLYESNVSTYDTF